MQQRISALRVVIGVAICLLALAGLPIASVAAQGCDDCRIIKGLPVATPRPAPPTAAGTTVTPSPAAPVVRMVLYWAEGCGHCREVLDGILPQMQQQNGTQLEVQLVEVVTMEDISGFFDVAEGYGFARGRAAVPFLLIGERALMGVEQITAQLPGFIQTYLTEGGVGWPDLTVSHATPQPAATGSAGCDFATPCADETAAVSGVSGPGGTRLRAAPASILGALGLAAVTGGGLAVSLTRRARRRRTRSSPPLANENTPTAGDNDAI